MLLEIIYQRMTCISVTSLFCPALPHPLRCPTRHHPAIKTRIKYWPDGYNASSASCHTAPEKFNVVGPREGSASPSFMKIESHASARTFVRSLNILLKFARLYEFGHVRTAAQFETTWKELRAALDGSGGTGLLLGASGNQILLDGVPLGAAAGERSFAQLLISSGIASIHFAPSLTQPQFARFVRAFPSGNAKPSSLSEQLKVALAGETGIKVNQIRYVAEDSSVAGIKTAANLAAKILGAQGDKYQGVFDDPNKLLQMILAAESSRTSGGGSGSGGSGGGGEGGTGTDLWESGGARNYGGGSGTASGAGTGAGGGTGPGGAGAEGGSSGGPGPGGWGGLGSGHGGSTSDGSGSAGPYFAPSGVPTAPVRPLGKWEAASALLKATTATTGDAAPPGLSGYTGASGSTFSVPEQEIRSVLGLFAQLGKSRKGQDSRLDAPTFQSRLSAMPRAQYTVQQALAGFAAQTPTEAPDQPMLLKLAEHVAIRFALDSFERGELRVNAVKQLLDRMNSEIEGLRKILGTQEQMMASAGLSVQSHTELLDQEFWDQVPEENKKEVLTSDEAWCVPPRNIRVYLEDMLRRGELKTVNEVLLKYVTCIAMEDPEARRTTAIGLSDLAELYGSGDGSALMDAIRRVGNQVAIEREPELQMLVTASFVRLSQEAASKRAYAAIHQALASLESIEANRPGSTQSLHSRIGAEERIPEFVEEALKSGHLPDGMDEILALMPQATLRYLTNRFAHCGFREDCELLGVMAHSLGADAQQRLMETIHTAPAAEAVEVIGLLSQLAPEVVELALPARLTQWPRTAHDRVVRQVSSVPAEQRARLLVALYDSLDAMIRPLAIDEMGMTGRPECIPKLLALVESDETSGFTRVKAIEAAGRLRATAAGSVLQRILEARQLWRWSYPSELRIAAAQALLLIDPPVATQKLIGYGLERKDLTLEPSDPEPNPSIIRQRRYARLKLSNNIVMATTNLHDNFKLTVPELNLGGGIGSGERHLAPGSLVALKIPYGVRPIKAQAIVRGARPQAMAFEFVGMDLDERSRLRKLLLELGALPMSSEAINRARRRGRIAISKN